MPYILIELDRFSFWVLYGRLSTTSCEAALALFAFSPYRSYESRYGPYGRGAPLKNFILPGGHPTVSQAHLARCVGRRAERRVVSLSREAATDPAMVRYLNRLSDYLFMQSRSLSSQLGVEEIKWRG